MEHKDPGGYIPTIYLLYSWGARFRVSSRVPLMNGSCIVGLHCSWHEAACDWTERVLGQRAVQKPDICTVRT